MDKKFLEDSIVKFLKAGDKDKLFACRMALSAIQKRESDKPMTEDQVLAIIKKESEELQEAALYNKVDEQKYINASQFLKSLLPAQIDQSEYDALIDTAIKEVGSESPKIGEVISKLKEKYGATLDYKIVSQKIKEKL
jgi:uncharacterized protein YqeY